LSDEVEAGWETFGNKNFGKSEAKGRKWLEENRNAVCEWRCRYVSEAFFLFAKSSAFSERSENIKRGGWWRFYLL